VLKEGYNTGLRSRYTAGVEDNQEDAGKEFGSTTQQDLQRTGTNEVTYVLLKPFNLGWC